VVIFNKKLRKEAFKYYYNRISISDFIQHLFSSPPRIKYQAELGQSCFYLPFSFFVLIKPGFEAKKDKIISLLKSSGVDILKIDLLKNFSDLIRILYEDDDRIKHILADAVFPKLEEESPGYALTCQADKKLDLIRLKSYIRKKVGLRFFHIVFDDDEMSLGLNSIHIPEREDMDFEFKIVQQHVAHSYTALQNFRDYSPAVEIKILIACCRPQPDINEIKALDFKNFDGHYLQRKLGLNYITPYFASQVKKYKLQQYLPPELVSKINKDLEYNISIHKNRATKLSEFSTKFKQKGLDFILIKGDANSRYSYDNIGHKIFWDHDVLINAVDKEKAVSLCLDLDLVPLNRNGIRISERELFDKMNLYHNVHLGPAPDHSKYKYGIPDDAVKLEIHWDLWEPGSAYVIPVEFYFENTRIFNGHTVVEPTICFLHLCLHQYKHSCHETSSRMELRQAVDMMRLVFYRHTEFNFDLLNKIINEHNLFTPVYYCLLRNQVFFKKELSPIYELFQRITAQGKQGLCAVKTAAYLKQLRLNNYSIC